MDRAVLNTENSYIGKDQLRNIIKGEYEVAVNLNISYMKKKNTYEFDQIVMLIDKYKESLKSDCKFTVEAEPFRLLKEETASFISEFQAIKNPSALKLREVKIKSRNFLKLFIKRARNEYNNKNVETT